MQLEKGDKLKIVDNCKDDLLSLYRLSSGMSGISNEHIDNMFLFVDRSGSNIRASLEENSNIVISLHYSRFYKTNEKTTID